MVHYYVMNKGEVIQFDEDFDYSETNRYFTISKILCIRPRVVLYVYYMRIIYTQSSVSLVRAASSVTNTYSSHHML